MAKQKEGAADLYAVRRQKKIRRIVRRVVIFAVLALVLLLVYQKRDIWIPRLETIGARHQSHLNEGSLTDGEFPLAVYGGSGYRAASMNGRLLVLSDTYLHIYDTNGNLESARQHTYGSAMLKTAGNYALIYESGGTRFRLETANSVRYEKSVTGSVIFGRVSENGQVLLVTTSETSACSLYVFNHKGQEVYHRSCVENITEANFNADDSGCYAVSIEAVNGILKSVVHAYSFSSETDLWSSQPLDMLVISVYNTSSGELFLLGDEAACYMTAGGAVKSTYTYPDALLQGDCIGNTAVLLLRNDEKRMDTVVMLHGDAASPVTRSYDKTVKTVGVLPESGNVLVQLRTKLETLRPDGALIGEHAVSDSWDGCLQIGAYLFLTGYDRIDRIVFRG